MIITPMTTSVPLPICSIGDEVKYSDTAENRILEIFRTVSDLSDGSDELAAEIDDWPTRYHCSPHRSNLLRPFRISPGTRVLEIGAGSGALTRYLGECGATVTAIEGARSRAEAAAMRCHDLKTVEILCGDFKHFVPEDPFDLVLIIGVLEYAGSGAGGRSTPENFLRHAVECINPSGALILAIENQLGLKYLLGGREDHLGKPWIGLEGYPGEHGIRTWGRRSLRTLLREVGLEAQRWLFPYPDYKLPSAILTETAFNLDRAPEIVDQWTAPPIVDHADPDRPIHDDRAIHRTFLVEGLGPDIANSFLVAATRREENFDAVLDDDTVIHHFGGNRRRCRRRKTSVHSQGDGKFQVVSKPLVPRTECPRSWILFYPDRDQPLFEGPNLEQEVLDACRKNSVDGVTSVLGTWWRHLEEFKRHGGLDTDASHPFLPDSGSEVLPASSLDVQLSNFIRSGSDVIFIDREWEAPPAVDADLVRFRALWYLARTVVSSGVPSPWPADMTVEDLAISWWATLKTNSAEVGLEQFYRAEAALQREVSGGDPEEIRTHLSAQGRLNRSDILTGRSLDTATLDLPALFRRIGALEGELNKATTYTRTLEEDLDAQRTRANEAERHFTAMEKTLVDLKQENSAATVHISGLENHVTELEAELERTSRHIENLERELQRASHHIENLEQELERASGHITDLEEEIGRASKHITEIETTLEAAHRDRADREAALHDRDSTITQLTLDLENSEIALRQTRERLDAAEAWRREFERRPLVRLFRRLHWLIPR